MVAEGATAGGPGPGTGAIRGSATSALPSGRWPSTGSQPGVVVAVLGNQPGRARSSSEIACS